MKAELTEEKPIFAVNMEAKFLAKKKYIYVYILSNLPPFMNFKKKKKFCIISVYSKFVHTCFFPHECAFYRLIPGFPACLPGLRRTANAIRRLQYLKGNEAESHG